MMIVPLAAAAVALVTQSSKLTLHNAMCTYCGTCNILCIYYINKIYYRPAGYVKQYNQQTNKSYTLCGPRVECV